MGNGVPGVQSVDAGHQGPHPGDQRYGYNEESFTPDEPTAVELNSHSAVPPLTTDATTYQNPLNKKRLKNR